MISFEEALVAILQEAHPLGKIRRRLEHLLGSVLAEPVHAPFALPRFDNSAVDGYGVLLSDVQHASDAAPVSLKLSSVIRAGDSGKVQLKPREAVQIFTGAPVPASVEAVVMQEFCERHDRQVLVKTPAKAGENIRRKGEEFQKSDRLLAAGTVVTPPVIGLLATLGLASAWVIRKPKVCLVTTGSELVLPGQPLNPGQIYDSNRFAMQAALKTIGIENVKVLAVKDERNATIKSLKQALAQADVVISLGGVSVGEFDFVKDGAEALGVETLFWRIAIKPGKPVYFGKQDRKLIFGLPGNPVSALVTYHQLVQPALLKMMGYPQDETEKCLAQLQKALRKKTGRLELVRGSYSRLNGQYRVQPTTGQDSHMLGGLANANCLIEFPTDAEQLSEKATVHITPFRWNPQGVL